MLLDFEHGLERHHRRHRLHQKAEKRNGNMKFGFSLPTLVGDEAASSPTKIRRLHLLTGLHERRFVIYNPLVFIIPNGKRGGCGCNAAPPRTPSKSASRVPHLKIFNLFRICGHFDIFNRFQTISIVFARFRTILGSFEGL